MAMPTTVSSTRTSNARGIVIVRLVSSILHYRRGNFIRRGSAQRHLNGIAGSRRRLGLPAGRCVAGFFARKPEFHPRHQSIALAEDVSIEILDLLVSLRAAKLFLVSNVPGILLDPADIETRVPRLTPAEARARIASGAIRGGMIPKVEESLAMLDAGIDQIHIVGSEPPEAVLGEAVEAGSFGTVFERP